MKDIS